MTICSYPSPPSDNVHRPPTSSEVSAGSVRVNLKDGHDTGGPGMTCDINCFTTFANLFGHFKALSCKNCRAPDEMRFRINKSIFVSNEVVTPYDTPSKVRMHNGDIYVIHVWSNVPGLQCADCKRTGYPKTTGVDKTLATKTPPTLTNSGSSETITLMIKDQTGFSTSLKMLNTTSFEYLMETYTIRSLRDRRTCRFYHDGEKLVAKNTPKDLALINGETIDVYIEQLGG